MSRRWHPTIPRHASPPRDWLAHPGSLTARLRAVFPHLSVRVLRQAWAQPNQDERHTLGLRAHQGAWVRDVVLRDGETPLVFAHSVLPVAQARGAWPLFAGLGARPLGEVLFSDPRITRGPMAFLPLDSRHPLYRAARATLAPGRLPKTLWARRSAFIRRGRLLLVTEVFLPDLLP